VRRGIRRLIRSRLFKNARTATRNLDLPLAILPTPMLPRFFLPHRRIPASAIAATGGGLFRCTFGLAIRLIRKGDAQVALGIVKWFNPTKGYGFIRPDSGGPDVFVHISAVDKAGYAGLAEGARVSFELFTGRNDKASAENLRLG